jgi:tetratricopeptide (TPR) repeat protein
MSADLFVSYSRRDAAAVAAVVERLRQAGHTVWIDQTGIDGAVRWSEAIVESLQDCKLVLAFVSGTAVASHHVVKELSLASEDQKPILPIHLEATVVPSSLRYQLAGLQHLTWYQGTAEDNFRSLMRALEHAGILPTSAALPETNSAVEASVRLGGPPWVFRRPELLREATNRLRSARPPQLVLQGLAGVGKTTLLCEIAAAATDGGCPAVAVRCDGPAAVEPAFFLEEINSAATGLGRGLDPEVLRRNRPADAVAKLAARLKGQALLLLLDGVEPAQDALLTTILKAFADPSVKVVLAGRQRPLFQPQALLVPPLSDAEAEAFVAERAGPLGLDVAPDDLIRRLPPGLRSHPLALNTLLAQLGDVPLDLLLEAGPSEEALTPLRLVDQAVASFDGPTRQLLGLVSVLSGLDFTTALKALDLPPSPATVASLRTLLARSLIHRQQSAYAAPALVREALIRTDPASWQAALDRIGAALRAQPPGDDGDATESVRVVLLARVVHHLAEAGRWSSVRDLTPEPTLERLNVRGHWKEYALLLRHSLEATRQGGDAPAHFRLACRLTRKLVQMGEWAGAKAALAEAEAQPLPPGDCLERAELHSHRAIVRELDRDEGAALRELEESRRLHLALGSWAGLAAVENLMGNLYVRRWDYTTARRHFESALSLLDANDVKLGAEVETSLALCDLAAGQAVTAETRLRSVLERCRAGGFTAGVPRALLHLALATARLGRTEEARGWARQAAEEAKDIFPAVVRASEYLLSSLEKQSAGISVLEMPAITPDTFDRELDVYKSCLADFWIASAFGGGNPALEQASEQAKRRLQDFCLASGRDIELISQVESELAQAIAAGMTGA